MRQVPIALTNAWRSGDFTGAQRPCARVTLSHSLIRLYNTSAGRFSSILFNQDSPPWELFNVRSVEWDRSADLEIANCTVTLWNTQPLPIGTAPLAGWLDLPGYYSPKLSAGVSSSNVVSSNPNFHILEHSGSGLWLPDGPAVWQRSLHNIEPDMMLTTYEGYGCTPSATPDQDPLLTRTGVWMIDEVDFGADGIITIQCRDIGRLLVDEIAFPPVVPLNRYPLSFASYQTSRPTTHQARVALHYHADSARNTNQSGHHAGDALDSSEHTFWWSEARSRHTDRVFYECTVQNQTLNGVFFKPWFGHFRCYVSVAVAGRWLGPRKTPDGFPYVTTVTCGGESFCDVRFHRTLDHVTGIRLTFDNLASAGNAPVAASSHTGGAVVQAIARAANEQGVPLAWALAIAVQESGLNPTAQGDYVGGSPTSFGLYQLHRGGELGNLTPAQAFDPYTNASRALSVVGQQRRANPGASAGHVAYLAQRPAASLQASYEANINNWVATNHPDIGVTADAGSRPEYRAGLRALGAYRVYTRPGVRSGNYGDYTDIVKLFCSMAGLYWPASSTVWAGGQKANYSPAQHDRVLAIGRAWGDFMATGTSGPVPIAASNFDKKPLLDGITYVRDIIGFHFAIDEDGGAIWRLPNWWNIGCFVQGVGYQPGVVHTLDENTVIRKLNVTLGSKNQRSNFFVANPGAKAGAVTRGFDDNPARLERVAIYEDDHFADQVQCRITADILAIRSYFTYRSDNIVISANPAIQVDDQARLTQATTNENYLHYIKGVRSSNDLESGRYEMTLSTVWLGNNPVKEWAFAPGRLAPETQSWLHSLGVI